ncbi:MAG: hypothetical protein LBH91_03180 [Prevotellaceae bacterium]|jgi:phage repressor protein C with HTH and peptisase S24 domain|nr:hypothetical protein [Prevotellaceae bacterium]
MNTRDRILQFVEYKNISKNKFYRETGLSNGFLDKNNNPGTDKIEQIIYAYPELSTEWLITGEGKMLKAEDNHNKTLRNKPKGIPLIPVEAMAGYGGEDAQVMGYEIQEDYILTPEFEGKGIKYLIRVSGSSMVPKYNNGDLLACKPITDTSFMQWGKVYVLDTDQGPLVKRLYACTPTDENCLECRSDNAEKYPPFKIPKTSIRKVAIVVGVLRLE